MTNTKRNEVKRPPWGGGPDAEEISFGTWLRQQREMREINLREIAEATKISLRYLEAFEQDRFDLLPASLFSRGFLRQYSGYVGLDPDEVMNHFLWAQQAVQPEEEEEAEGPRPQGAMMPMLLGVIGLLLVTLLMGLLYVYYGRSDRDIPATPREQFVPPPENRAPAAQLPAEIAPVPGSEVAEPIPAEAALEETLPSASGAAPGAAAGGSEPAQPATESPAIVPPANLPPGISLQVDLAFSDQCWAEVVVDGSLRISRLYGAGESERIEARRSVVLRKIGNAGGVQVRVNGRTMELPGGRGTVIGDVRIDAVTAQQLAEGKP